MTHLLPSYLKNAYCGRADWWNSLSSEVSLFLTDIKCLAKNKQRGILFVPFWCLSQKLSLLVLYFNKTLLHKKLQVVKPHLWPWIETLSSRGLNPGITHGSQPQPFKINTEYSLEAVMLKLKLQYFGHLMWRANSLEKTLILGKIEYGWMASLTQ